ncbi:MAG: NADH-quinone oxidoreductase subunit NuoE [Candidatus Promineifilaceae bacterium]|nr:NADH-quinone oxidoreductase subunit NuoE [Candidatus Promineifilaceae bacterium]
MLSDEERREIEAEIAHYEYRQAACIEALKILQRTRGWISDESIQDLTGILEMTADEIDNVATFYNLIFRQPVGDHVILLCDSVSCWLMGYEELHSHLRQALGVDFGQTTKDGRFTLLPMVCLGACDHAPVMMVDEDLHRDLTAEKVDEILDNYR